LKNTSKIKKGILVPIFKISNSSSKIPISTLTKHCKYRVDRGTEHNAKCQQEKYKSSHFDTPFGFLVYMF
jgi:hypothetical protein